MRIETFCGYNFLTLAIAILVYATMEIVNIIFMGSVVNLLLTVPLFGYVIFLLFKGDLRKAFLCHMIFVAVSFDNTSVLSEGLILSYGKIKCVGPISFMHIMMGVFYIMACSKYPLIQRKTMIFRTYKLLLKMFYMGIIVGFIGFLFNSDYSFNGFLGPFVYMVTGLLHLNVMLRLYDKDYLKLFFVNAWMLLIASIIATFITYRLGYTAEYSLEEVYLYNEFYFLVPCLLIGLFQLRVRTAVMISLCAFVLFISNAIAGGARGSTFMTLFAAILMCIYTVYTTKNINIFVRSFRMVIPFVIFFGLPSVIIYLLNTDGLTRSKFMQFMTLFTLFDFSSDFFTNLSFVSTSPYIRICEVVDIIDNYLHDFISLPFGRGYGGYYTDNLGLFAHLDLTQGGFSPDVVAKGKFSTAHSVFPSALLFNGFIGLYLVLKLGFSYIKRVNVSFLCFAGFLLFCYSLYFNPLMFLASLFCLYSAEYQLTVENKNICVKL